MAQSLRLLLIEDSEDDAMLLTRKIHRAGYELAAYKRVQTAETLHAALTGAAWDVIIADYSMPGFNGLAALEIYKQTGLDIPFIIVSGTIGENIAVAAMKAGAHDYLMKDNLARLIPAIERELQEAIERNARRQAEDQLRKLSRALEQSPNYILITDLNGVIEYANPSYIQHSGYAYEEITGQTHYLFHQDAAFQEIQSSLQRVQEWRGELLERHRDGSVFWSATKITAIRDHTGSPTHYLILQEDITERKLAEKALRDSEEKFRQLVESAADAIFLIDKDGGIVDVNEQACVSLHYTRPELLQGTCSTICVGKPELLENWARHREQLPTTISTRNRRKDGSTFPVEIRLSMFEDKDQSFLLAVVRDTTEREEFQRALKVYSEQLEDLVEVRTEQLRQSSEQIEAILDNSGDAIVLVEPNGDIKTANVAFKQLFGHRVTQSVEHLLELVVDPSGVNTMTRALTGTLRNGNPSRTEVRLTCRDEETIDVDVVVTPVKNKHGRLVGAVLSLRDITHLKEIERFKAQFIANAAHDLANPISNLKLHLYALKQASPDNMPRYISALESQTRRLESLVSDLRTLSQIDRGILQIEPSPMDLNQLIDEVVMIHEPKANRKQQRLIFDPSDDRLVIMADYDKFERVVVNLVANALNYTPEGGQITVQTGRDDQHAFISVSDTGIGIAENELPHIFERFYRSEAAKHAGIDGTGLGLAIVKEIVETHGGSVSATSVANTGSTFTIRMPITAVIQE